MEQAEKMCDHIGIISHGRLELSGELRAIKHEMGGNSYRLLASGDLGRIKGVPGIEQVLEVGSGLKLRLLPEAEGSAVLRELVGFLDVREFRSEEPDLEEIFKKAVGDAA
jgi:ABC-2 type transport system ATP-binding protein